MDTHEFLAPFTIPTPCSMAWDRMSGDDRVRYCEACGKDVYNLTEMTSDEVSALLASLDEQGGELCGRAFQRPDGTLVTSECHPGRRVLRGWQFNLKSAMVLIGWFAAMLGFTRWLASMSVVTAGRIQRRPPGLTSGSGGPTSPTVGAGNAADECPADECVP